MEENLEKKLFRQKEKGHWIFGWTDDACHSGKSRSRYGKQNFKRNSGLI